MMIIIITILFSYHCHTHSNDDDDHHHSHPIYISHLYCICEDGDNDFDISFYLSLPRLYHRIIQKCRAWFVMSIMKPIISFFFTIPINVESYRLLKYSETNRTSNQKPVRCTLLSKEALTICESQSSTEPLVQIKSCASLPMPSAIWPKEKKRRVLKERKRRRVKLKRSFGR